MKVVEFAEGLAVNSNGISVILDFCVIDNLFSKVSMVQENGGVFYGYKLSNIQEYRILGFTDPFEKDNKKLFNFDRLDSRHIEYIKNKWINDKSIMYLGDWHSHPAQKSEASVLDRDTWKKISKKSKTNSLILVFSIISQNEILNCVYNKKGKEIFSFILSKNQNHKYYVKYQL
jgi:integrative and conjugative element protein (TIGR02256 family)